MDNPDVAYPHMGNPHQENPAQLNTKESSNNLIKYQSINLDLF